MYFLRIEYLGWELGKEPRGISAAVLDLSDSNVDHLRDSGDGDTNIEILDVAFYNDETSVLLVRARGEFLHFENVCFGSTWHFWNAEMRMKLDFFLTWISPLDDVTFTDWESSTDAIGTSYLIHFAHVELTYTSAAVGTIGPQASGIRSREAAVIRIREAVLGDGHTHDDAATSTLVRLLRVFDVVESFRLAHSALPPEFFSIFSRRSLRIELLFAHR